MIVLSFKNFSLENGFDFVFVKYSNGTMLDLFTGDLSPFDVTYRLQSLILQFDSTENNAYNGFLVNVEIKRKYNK